LALLSAQAFALNRVTPSGRILISVTTGNPDFRGFGISYYDLARRATVGGSKSSCDSTSTKTDAKVRTDLEATFASLKAMNVNIVRFWAFQDYAGQNGTDFTFMNYLLEFSEKHQVYLMPVLLNKWGDCQSSWAPDDAYYKGGYKTTKSSKWSLTFPEYAKAFAAHINKSTYKNNVFAIQIGNELAGESYSDTQLAPGMLDLAKTVSNAIRAETNTMISFGSIGNNQPGVGDWTLKHSYAIHGHANISFVSVHDYDLDSVSWRKLHAANRGIAIRLNKPFLVTELGFDQRKYSCATSGTYYDQKTWELYSKGGAALFYWGFRDGAVDSATQSYDVSDRANSCLGGKIKARNAALKNWVISNPYPTTLKSTSLGITGSIKMTSSQTCDSGKTWDTVAGSASDPNNEGLSFSICQ